MAADQPGGTLRPGEILNNTYVIEELVAVGGTGEVYRARNRASDREIAVKILRREFAGNETFLDLMRREASVLHEVQDDAVVRYYDILQSDAHGGFVFLVMEFIRGESLAERMRRGPLDEETCLTIARRIARGLKASHDKKAYHRDLSPDNVILRNGDPAQAVLIDFGIAKDVSEDARTVIGGGFAGKYQYAAPEQLDGRADGRSDLYALGMTLIGAFRGRAPHAGASYLDIIRAKAEKPDIADLPDRLRALVDRLVEPDPDRRLQTPAEVLAFLDSIAGGAAPPGPPPPAQRRTAAPGP
ncbi:MAG: serine/threonine protein kinase, partial [Alphaproteobacteria bacterium]